MVRITIPIADPVDATPSPTGETSRGIGGTASFVKALTFVEPKYESSNSSDRFEHRNRLLGSWMVGVSGSEWLAFENGKLQTVEMMGRIGTSKVDTL